MLPNPKDSGPGKGRRKTKLTKLEQALRQVEKLGNNIPGPIGRDPFSPDPTQTVKDTARLYPTSSIPKPDNSDFRMKGVNKDTAGKDIIAQLRAQLKKGKLAKGLPPIKTTPSRAPGVMTPGTGVAGSAASALSKIKAGKMPKIDTDLDVNDKGIFKRAGNAASMEYDPQIEAIKQLIESTNQQGNRGIQQTGNAYGALQSSLQRQVPGINQVYDNAQAQQAELMAKLTGDIDARYNATNSRNAAEFERLGIQAATPSTSAALTSDRDFLSSIAGLQGAGIQGALELQQQGSAGMARSNAMRAGFEGANQTTEQREELARKILDLRTQKTSLTGNKARAKRELTDQYKEEAVAQAERNRAFNLDAAQFRESVHQDRRNFRQGKKEAQASMEEAQAGLALDAAKLKQEAQKQAAQGANFKDLDPQERAAAKADQLVPGSGDRMFAYLQNLINSDKNIRRGFYLKQTPDGRTMQVKITPEQFGYLAAKQAKLTGLPKGSVQKIATAYWMER